MGVEPPLVTWAPLPWEPKWLALLKLLDLEWFSPCSDYVPLGCWMFILSGPEFVNMQPQGAWRGFLLLPPH